MILNIKYINLLALTALVYLMSACQQDDPVNPQSSGTFTLEFDNRVGAKPLTLETAGSENYMYTTTSGQAFNLTTFGYYISKIKLEGPDGAIYEDEMKVSPNADEVKGYYQVLQSNAGTHFIELKNVPAGTYNKVTFTVGIDEDGVKQGAAGGILDPAEGAWFWNWNAGYIGFAMEGGSPNSAQEAVAGDGFTIPAKSFALHIGGWKDVSATTGEEQKFVNNVKTITLGLDSDIMVSEKLAPNAHIVVDVLKVLGDVDFATTYAVHSPKPGQPFAARIPQAFILDHTHQ